MKIVVNSDRYKLRNDHPYAQAIIALARAYQFNPRSADELPARNDVKQLWRNLSPAHRELLHEIATRPNGIPQADLEAALGLDWKGLRGVHNGLARICDGLGVQKPVRALGYNAGNRRYLMDPDVAATVKALYARDP